MLFRRFALLLVVVVSLSAVSFSQNIESGFGSMVPQTSVASFYYVAKPGEMTMQVNIWGDVQKPGRYEVGTTTDLIQLLSFAGGPTRDADLSQVRISRFVRSSDAVLKQQVKVNLEDFFKTDESKLPLLPGDAIFVDYSTRLNIRDVFTVLATAAVITTAVTQIMYLNR
jgi:hypothetical protein